MDPRPGPSDPLAGIAVELESLDGLPTADHVAVFGRVHSALTTALAATTAGDQPTPGR